MARRDREDGSPEPNELSLAGEFPAVSSEAWLALVQRILGDRSYRETLVSETYDGIAIEPLYTAADWPAKDDPSGFPGMAPFTRGQHVTGRAATGWEICQRHSHPDRSVGSDAIRQDVQRGVMSILLRLDQAGRQGLDSDAPAAATLAGVDGVMIACADDLDDLLAGVDLGACAVGLDGGMAFLPAAAMLAAVWRNRGIDGQSARGAFNADPLGALAAGGVLPGPIDRALHQLADLACFTATAFPHVTSIAVDTTPYHNAGASEAQELACAMATGVAYLRALVDHGLALDRAIAQVVFVHATDADLLLSIAKLRAARRLWGRVAEACGVPEATRGMRLHAITSERMMSRRDPWVNILRATVSGFAAAVGGADSIAVLPFSSALGLPDPFARRIARNTQLVLQEESSLNRVIDPAGGAWAVESLTDALAREGWSAFQDIERGGGMAAALLDGSLADRIAAVAAARERNIATADDPLTGLSTFADLFEQPVSVLEPDLEALRADATRRLRKVRKRADPAAATALAHAGDRAADGSLSRGMVDAATAGATLGALAETIRGATETRVDALPRRRLGAAFEALRDASDAHRAATGASPAVFLAVIGTPAQFTARASFAGNLFAAGGIEATLGDGGTDVHAITAGFKASGYSVAVICSDDTAYYRHGAALAAALKAAGAERIYVVGRLAAAQDRFAGAPVDGMLYQGCDVLGLLTGTLERMGVVAR